MIKPAVSGVQADLLRQLPLLLVTATDAAGQTWASALVGPRGFVSAAPDPSVVTISAAHLLGDGEANMHRRRCPAVHPPAATPPAAAPVHPTRCLPARCAGPLALRRGQQVGCLGILLSSRRRVRVNGILEGVERGPGGLLQLRVKVQQAYNNCPKYIQVGSTLRSHAWPAAGSLAARLLRRQWQAALRALVAPRRQGPAGGWLAQRRPLQSPRASSNVSTLGTSPV